MPEEEEYFDETHWLKPIGFKPGRAMVFNDPTTFKVSDVLDSLCKSTYTHPMTIAVPIGTDMTAPIVVDMARRMWIADERPGAPAREVAYHDNPDWYVEGQVQQSTVRIRMYVITCDGVHIDSVRLQFISDEEVPDGIIRVVSID